MSLANPVFLRLSLALALALSTTASGCHRRAALRSDPLPAPPIPVELALPTPDEQVVDEGLGMVSVFAGFHRAVKEALERELAGVDRRGEEVVVAVDRVELSIGGAPRVVLDLRVRWPGGTTPVQVKGRSEAFPPFTIGAVADEVEVALRQAAAAARVAVAGLIATGQVPEPVVPPPAPPGNHFLAVQGGGGAFLTINYRYRLVPLLILDVGGFGAPECVNASAGLINELWHGEHLLLYTAWGLGFAGCSVKCAADDPTCETGSLTVVHGYGRLGLAVLLGDQGRHRIAVDGGGWYGEVDDVGDRSPLFWPMGGLGYSYQF